MTYYLKQLIMNMYLAKLIFLLVIFITFSCNNDDNLNDNLKETKDNSEYFFLTKTDILKKHDTKYFETYGKYISGYNLFVLKAIDSIQAKFPDGGAYFIGITANPPESPIGYDLSFLGKSLLKAPRTTSYCSGASYTAFIEALNLIFKDKIINKQQLELIRMQEKDGGRREDGVKLWGNWNADGFGTYDALVSYTNIGKSIKPQNARPGDFMNISWKSGYGHSVVFIGWYKENNDNFLAYWSSQKSTNGLGFDTVNVNKINAVSIVRLTKPENIFKIDSTQKVSHTRGDKINL